MFHQMSLKIFRLHTYKQFCSLTKVPELDRMPKQTTTKGLIQHVTKNGKINKTLNCCIGIIYDEKWPKSCSILYSVGNQS